MFRILIAAMVLAGLCAGLLDRPAAAQGRKPYSAMSDDEKANQKIADTVDQQYRNALERTRKAPTEIQIDPWSNMRSNETTPAKKK
ncbi:MAG: hypothetical protein WC670_18110 [Pseudolabrys sp.]